MLSQIRAFEAERQEWETERDAIVKEKEEAKRVAADLAEEMKRLRECPPSSLAAAPSPSATDLEKSLRAHHVQTVKLMATIDELRTELQQEQSKAKTLEQSNSALEQRAGQAERELGRIRDMSTSLDNTISELDVSLRPAAMLDQNEVLSLEDENLKLREELNASKKRVIELKQAAHQRKLTWKEELDKITEELSSKQKLEGEVAAMRQQMAALNTDLQRSHDTIHRLRQEAETLQRAALQAPESPSPARPSQGSEDPSKAEEMEMITARVGEQLVSVEQELTNKLRKSSELWELFLTHSQEPTAAILHWARDAAASGYAGKDLWMRRAPVMFSSDVRELKANLVKFVEILRYVAEIHAAYNPQGPEASVMARLEEGKEWLKSVLI